MKLRIEPWSVIFIGYSEEYDETGLIIYGPKHPERGYAGRLRWSWHLALPRWSSLYGRIMPGRVYFEAWRPLNRLRNA